MSYNDETLPGLADGEEISDESVDEYVDTIDFSDGPEFEEQVRQILAKQSQITVVYTDTGATDILELDEDGDIVAAGIEDSDEDDEEDEA